MLKKLIDEPQWVPLIAELKFQHYQSIAKSKTLDDFRKGVEKDLNESVLPIGYVLTEKDSFVGAVSLRACDLDSHSHLTPWLGGVFVHPEWRGKGIGTLLVKEGERLAKERGFHHLYLYTHERAAWYQKQGWTFYDTASLHEATVTILLKQLS